MTRAERSRSGSPRWPLLVLLAAALGCGSKPAPRSAGDEIEPIYDPVGDGDQPVETIDSAPASASQCRTPRASEQMRVGFRMPVQGAAAERSAAEAPRILSLLEAQLCELDPKQDPEGSLRTALGAGLLLEISALTFTRKDASRADVHLQLVSSASANPDGTSGSQAAAELVAPPRWVLKLVRAKDSSWRIASASAR